MLFPGVLAVVGGACLLGLVVSGQLRRTADTASLSLRDLGRLAEIVVWVVVYLIFAETAGFLLTAGVLLALLLIRLGNRWFASVAISLAVVAVTYELFAVVLKVPLPRGWLGW